MKFLITAGSPKIKVPSIGLNVSVDESLNCLDGHEVAKALVKNHEVTILTSDPGAKFNEELKGATVIVCEDLAEFTVKLTYLIKESGIAYDTIAHLADVPRFATPRIFGSDNEISALADVGTLYELNAEKRWSGNDFWVRLRAHEDGEWNEIVELFHEAGPNTDSFLILRDNIPFEIAMKRRLPHDYIDERIDELKASNIGMTILDPHKVGNRGMLEAYIFTKYDGQKFDSVRLASSITNAIVEGPKARQEEKERAEESENVEATDQE